MKRSRVIVPPPILPQFGTLLAMVLTWHAACYATRRSGPVTTTGSAAPL